MVERSWWALAALVLVAAIVVSLVLAPGAVLTGRAGGQVPAAGRCAPPQLARGLCPPATARLGQKP